jgi:DNA (cytosine-5)-methyltransferase 1
MIVDLFAGPGGWEAGLSLLNHDEPTIGIEWDKSACATRAAVGLPTIRASVAEYPAFGCRVLIASPPCQAFSMAGNQEGIKDQPRLFELIEAMRLGARWDELDLSGEWQDERSRLVLEPLRWVEHAFPEVIALEQVPAVLPLWTAMGHVWEKLGYRWVAEKLCAADYGVPQTRERAILIASRTRSVQLPPPTHTDTRQSPSLFLEPWVSMAEALGWHNDGVLETGANSMVTGRTGSKAGDGDVQKYERETSRPAPVVDCKAGAAWKVGFPRRDDRGGDGYRERDWRSIDEPAQTLTEKGRSWQLNTGRDWKPGGSRDDAQTIDGENPAPSLTAKSGGQWHLTERRKNGASRSIDEPAQTICSAHDNGNLRWTAEVADEKPWAYEQPSTTIATRPLAPDPGANANRFNDSTKSRNDGIRLSERDGLILQSFDPDYPIQGNRTKRWQQIGNAIPPRLAAAVLKEVL